MKNNLRYTLKLEEFMKNIIIENKNFSIYEDVKGNMFKMNTISLVTRVDYMELSTEKVGENGASEYEKALFNQSIDRLNYNSKQIKVPVPKSEITGNKEDSFTLTEKNENVVMIWKVSNTLGAFKCFATKNEALEFAKSINSKIDKYVNE